MDETELAEYVIKRILAGDVFFIGKTRAISFIEKEIPFKFEGTDMQVKLRGFDDPYEEIWQK